jgi:RNase P/RNase MRP subunit p29
MDLEEIPPEIERRILNDTRKHFEDVALFFRKLSGLTISAVVDTSTEMIGYKDNIVDVTKQFWVHPHQYIRRKIGKQGEVMDYDIASYVHGYL